MLVRRNATNLWEDVKVGYRFSVIHPDYPMSHDPSQGLILRCRSMYIWHLRSD